MARSDDKTVIEMPDGPPDATGLTPRQQRVLATRMAELTRDFDAQRRVDLAAIDQGMARLQNTSGAEVRQYRDLIQRMYRATSYQQK